MAARTISLHASGETARMVEHLSRVEDRSPSQIAAAALAFYLRLPPEAHSALRHVQALGEEDDVRGVMRGVTRLLLNAQYDVAVRRMGEALRHQGGPVPETEEEMLEEANQLIVADAQQAAVSSRGRTQTRKAG
jgi:predicted transcriptional regulator